MVEETEFEGENSTASSTEAKEKPLWLEALEKQSWQAELIASGLAIYGSLALGPFIDDAVTYVSTIFNDRLLDKSVWVFIYLYLIHSILVVAFIAHLALRILWAGIIGLSSVYPEGINLENKSFPRHFLEKVREEFPSLSDYSLHIDNICSRVFANLCSLIFVFFAITLWILLVIGSVELIYYFFQVDILKPLLIGLGIVYGLFVIFSLIYVSGPKKESEVSKKYSYILSQKFSKFLMLGVYKPWSYIMWVQRTNQSTTQFILGFLLIFPISILTGVKVGEAISQLESKDYFEMNASPYFAKKNNYLDTNNNNLITRPIIQSKKIKDNYLELFIPKLKREQVARIEICGKFETDLDRKQLEYVDVLSNYQTTCATKYYTISLDDGEPIDLEYQYIRNNLNRERGITTYIPIDSLTSGNHILKIKTGYQLDGKFAERVIPFYKTK